MFMTYISLIFTIYIHLHVYHFNIYRIYHL